MTVLVWVVTYAIMTRAPQKDCSALKCVNVSCSVSCYEASGESHVVGFLDREKAEQFYSRLAPYNHTSVLDKDVPDNQRFILGLELAQIKGSTR